MPKKKEDRQNLPARRGGQPGNANALKHGQFSTRFSNLIRLTGPSADPAPDRGPLGRHLDLLEAVIEDLAAQAQPRPELLIKAIRTFAQVAMTNALLEAARTRTQSRRQDQLSSHSNCSSCNAIWVTAGLDDQGQCPRCAGANP